MSISVSNALSIPYRVVGARKMSVTDVTLDSAYPSGGEAVTAAQLGLNNVEHAVANIKTVTSGTVDMVEAYPSIQTDGSIKVVVYDQTPVDVGASGDVDLTAAVIRVTSWGT